MAVIVVIPGEMTVARPLLLTVATDGFDELQVTCVVISWAVPSEYVPLAVNCGVNPTCTLGLAGVTVMEERIAAAATVRVAFPEIVPEVAVMVAVPAAMAIARPLLLTTATDGFAELQVTCCGHIKACSIRICPRGCKLRGDPGGRDAPIARRYQMEDRVAGVTVKVVLTEIFPEKMVMVAVPAAMAIARPLLLTSYHRWI